MTWHWWRATKRRMDLLLLWPQCVKRAPSVEKARGAFFLHMQLDPGTYGDMSEAAKIAYAEALQA